MSIWFGPKGKTYTGTGENSWLKRYIEHLTGTIRQELTAHCDGSVLQHRAENIVYDDTRTVKTALQDEAKERSKAEENLQKALEQKLMQETEERSAGDVAILDEMHRLNIKNGVGAGSLQSLHSTKETGLDGVQTGNDCHAKGDYSNAQNHGTIASGFCQSVRGRFNKQDDGTYADIVGNGTGDGERSNAYTLDWDGNGWFLGDVMVGKEKKTLLTKDEAEQEMKSAEKRISSLEAISSGLEKPATVTADAGATLFYTVPKGYRLKSVETVNVKLAEGIIFPIDVTQVLEFALFDSDDNGIFSGEIKEGATEINVTYPYDIEDGYAGRGFYFDLYLLDKETDELSRIEDGIYTVTINFTLETVMEERFDILETEMANKVNQDTILTEVENYTLVLEEHQDVRLGETETLALSLPESIGDWYKSTFSFQSGEKATSLAYGYTPLNWKGDDVTSDGRFVPEPFSTYEVDIKNLGVNGIRARVDKIAGYASVDVEGTILSLPDSAGKDLRDYKIYGNSVQNGDPTEESPVAIQSVGNYNEETGMYDVPITVHGKNLCDKRYIADTSNWSFLNNSYRSIPVYVGKGNTVTISHGNILAPGLGFYFAIMTANSTADVYTTWIYHDTISSFIRQTATITAIEDYIYMRVSVGEINKGFQNFMPNIGDSLQIEIGNTATEYQPYREPASTTISLTEPLRKLGDVADYIDFKNNYVIQQVEVLDDTGAHPIEESYAAMDEPMFSYHTGEWGERFIPEIKTNLYDNVITVDTEIQPSNVKVTYFKKG